MRKHKIFIVLIGLMVLVLPYSFGNAWSNGSYAYNQNDYDYETDYGTHDWIAEGALEALIEHDEDQWKWLEYREIIFLVGTEAPDNSGVSITLDGETLSGFGDTTYHHIYYEEDGSIKNNEDDSALRAKWCGDWADASIESGKLDQAAFYFGAMTHYIADLSMYAHVADNYVYPYNLYFDEHHSTVESRVQSRTNEYDDREEFFKYSQIIVGNKKPYDAAVDLGWETYKDPTCSEATSRDALWLHENFFSNWVLTYSQRQVETNETKRFYYNRIEECLNNAIEACASAMNNVGGFETPLYTFPSYPMSLLILILSSAIIGVGYNEIKKKNISLKNLLF